MNNISAKDLHYLFTYLPYRMDVLHTEIENFIADEDHGYYAENNKKVMAESIHKLLSTLNSEEFEELKGLLDKLDKKESCLAKNQNYSLETCKKGIEKMGKRIRYIICKS